jgi:hypothetical protein
LGISAQVIKALVQENKFKPIEGEFLSFGRQTINVSKEKLYKLCESILSPDQIDALEIDEVTRHSDGKKILDKSLMEALFKINYHTVDKSDYENPNLILDLTGTIPNQLHGKYDFIFSGGTLDNVFNPAQLIINASKLLNSKGGRILHFEAASRVIGAYSFVTPEWFYSYYAVNSYEDVKVYLAHQSSPGMNRFDYDLDIYNYTPSFSRARDFDYFNASRTHPGIQYLICIAEKGENSSDELIPHQLQYLDGNAINWCAKEEIFKQSLRPLLATTSNKIVIDLPYFSNHFTYQGSEF